MRTITKPTSRVRSLGLLIVACALASCGADSPPGITSEPVAFQRASWSKINTSPPTYFPKGIPANHPTTHKDGSWVMTGDSVGTRYFIPLRGVDRCSLIAEAMSQMTPERSEQLRKGVNPDVSLASGISNAALGLGYLLLEVDAHAAAERSRHDYGPAKGVASVWEKTPRR